MGQAPGKAPDPADPVRIADLRTEQLPGDDVSHVQLVVANAEQATFRNDCSTTPDGTTIAAIHASTSASVTVRGSNGFRTMSLGVPFRFMI